MVAVLLSGYNGRTTAGRGVCVKSDEVMEQVQQLIDCGLIVRRLMMSRCSLCNTVLREATLQDFTGADYAPRDKNGLTFCWCEQGSKLCWNGSHTHQLMVRIGQEK
jgi:hypothetical protein